MPHIVIEHTSGVRFPTSIDDFLLSVNQSFAECDTINITGIKSRAYEIKHACSAANEASDFLYMKVAVLPGRDEALKRSIIEHLLAFLKVALLPLNENKKIHLSVELTELSQYAYFIHERSA